jgi:hypothetical protein
MAEHPDPEVGRDYGGYLIRSRLGQGNNGSVYLAVGPPPLRKEVALKLSLKDDVGAFMEEAQKLVTLSSPYVVEVYDCGQAHGRAWLAMRHIAGETLKTAFEKRSLTTEDLRAIVAHVGRGLLAIHEHELVHRDIKPENIMLQPLAGGGYHAVIIDLGIAKDLAVSRDTVSVRGTPRYMAPEQSFLGRPGPHTDVFSFALVVTELLATSTIDRGDAPADIACKTPRAFWSALIPALDFDPAKRPSLKDFLNDLDRAFADTAPLKPAAVAPATLASRGGTEERTRDPRPTSADSSSEADHREAGLPWWVWVLLFLGMFGLGAAAFIFFHRSNEEGNLQDGGVADTWPIDARVVDARVVDARVVNAQVADARVVDARVVDARVVDARVVDAARPDAARPDAARPDANQPESAQSASKGAEGRKKAPAVGPKRVPERPIGQPIPVVHRPVGAPTTGAAPESPIKDDSPPSTKPDEPQGEPPLPPGFEEKPLPPGFR